MRQIPEDHDYRPASARSRVLTALINLLAVCLCIGMLPAFGSAADLSLEKDLQDKLARTKKVVRSIREKQQTGLSTRQETKTLKTLAEDVAASHLLMKERFRLRDEKVKRLNSKARKRHDTVKAGYLKTLEEYLALLNSIPPSGDAPSRTLEKLEKLLDRTVRKKKNPILGSLPYRHLDYTAVPPIDSPTVIPAYRGGNQAFAPEDTLSTDLAPITLEIATLAESLGWSPVAIYEYVKNNIETEWYWGCMKGAEETLHQKSGNDCDQATLLAALLRAAGYPTRYVRGVAEFFPDVEKAKNLTGIADPEKLGEFFQKAGIPHEVVMNGPVQNIRIEHLWVETYVPYSNYRGVIMDDQGKTWIALDTSMKAGGYSSNNPTDIISEYPLTTIRDEYLSTLQSQTPLEYVQQRINDYLAQNHPGHTYTDYLSTRTLNSEVLNILPSSLQFKEIAITEEHTTVPSDLVHKVNFTAKDLADNELFNVTVDANRLSDRKVILSHEPESVDDQESINSFGGLDNTPAYLVRLRPVLMIDGERVAVAADGVAMGGDYTLQVSVISPNGAESFTNSMISGNMVAIGIAGRKAVVPAAVDDKVASDLLYREALRYIDNWNKGEDELASLLQVLIIRPVPTIATVGNAFNVPYLLDQPLSIEWKGLFVDADLKAVEALPRTTEAGGRALLFTQLSALQGSALEHKLFEDAFGVDSISADKVAALANAGDPQIPILTIDQSNVDTLLPTLPFDENVKNDILDSVNQGYEVRTPNAELVYRDWSGIGYIKENPATGEAGYMLSGRIAGGMTAVSPGNWPAESLGFIDVLNRPYRENNKRIMITSPQNESLLDYSPITVTGIVLDQDATITVNGVSAYREGDTFIAEGVKLNPWENLISADSVTPAGVTSHDSVAITYKIPLQIAITFPYDGSALANTPVFIEGAVSDPTATVTVNNVKATVLADGRFVANNIPLSEGANTITATAINRVNETASSTATLNYQATDPAPALSVSITSPAGGATINNEAVTVSGTINSTAQEMSVKVNGVLAEIYNGQFNANNVPLADGNNIIIADASDANGAIARSQITFTANTTAPHVTLSSNIQGGTTPLTTYFSFKTNIQNPITGYQLDFGDGSAPYTGTTFESVSHTYAAEGVFHPVLTVTDSLGNVYTDTIAITMMNKAALDALLTSKWDEIKAKLSQQDITGAVASFSPRSQDRYREIFTAISSNLPQIVQDMQAIQLIYVNDNTAKYRIRKDEVYGGQAVTITYYIYYKRDSNGMWKIEKF